MTGPVLYDLFCKAGGASRGYQEAGFYVVGVDIEPQPNYIGNEFICADALEVDLSRADAIHASPPCHDHTALSSLSGKDGTGDLLAATRERLQAAGVPWVIENVVGAPMRVDLMLCGYMFGLRIARHRWFESSAFLLQPGHHRHVVRTVTRNRRAAWAAGLSVSVTGDVGVYLGPEALGIDWMTGDELSQAIPPAYTAFIGEQLVAHLAGEARGGSPTPRREPPASLHEQEPSRFDDALNQSLHPTRP